MVNNIINISTEFKCPQCIRGKMEFKGICGSVSVYECNTCDHIEKEKTIHKVVRRLNKK